jgi:hypothetical protein
LTRAYANKLAAEHRSLPERLAEQIEWLRGAWLRWHGLLEAARRDGNETLQRRCLAETKDFSGRAIAALREAAIRACSRLCQTRRRRVGAVGAGRPGRREHGRGFAAPQPRAQRKTHRGPRAAGRKRPRRIIWLPDSEGI